MLSARQLNRSIVFLGFAGLFYSAFLAVVAFAFASEYDAAFAFSQISRGVNPFGLMAEGYALLPFAFVLYLLFQLLRERRSLRLISSLAAVAVVTFLALLLMPGVHVYSSIGNEFPILYLLLKTGSVCFFILSIVLMLLNVFFYIRGEKDTLVGMKMR